MSHLREPGLSTLDVTTCVLSVIIGVVACLVGGDLQASIHYAVASDAVVVDFVFLEQLERLLLVAVGDVEEQLLVLASPWSAVRERLPPGHASLVQGLGGLHHSELADAPGGVEDDDAGV